MNPPREPLLLWLVVAFCLGFIVSDIARDYREPVEEIEEVREVRTTLGRQLEKPQVGTIKLSEAIRIGAEMRPKCDGEYFLDGASCALGAAWEGAGQDPRKLDGYQDIRALFRISEALSESIAVMNDKGRSRESIADWLQARGL